MNEEKKNEEQGIDAFLTDESEAQEDVDYIQPDIELKLPKHKRQECRDIIREIKDFGVRGQRQILYLIYLLALEVENQDTMKAIVDACKSGRKELDDEKKLVLPGQENDEGQY